MLNMARVTSKYQVTVPRKIADQFRIQPGDEIDWTPAGDVIRVTRSARNRRASQPADKQKPGWIGNAGSACSIRRRKESGGVPSLRRNLKAARAKTSGFGRGAARPPSPSPNTGIKYPRHICSGPSRTVHRCHADSLSRPAH